MPWHETPTELERAFAERPVIVPAPEGDLVGIFTPPAPAAPPAGICVLVLSRPRFEHHRMAVAGARRLATYGFASFRLDYHGWGESEGEVPVVDLDLPYREDVLAVIDYLRTQMGQRRFVLWGSCFDARTAISVFEDAGSAIDGLAFIAAPVTTVATSDVYNWSNALRLGFDAARWRELIFSDRARHRAIRALKLTFGHSVGKAFNGQFLSLSPVFEAHFKALVRSHARALFLYGLEDEEYRSFRVAEEHLIARLDPSTRCRFEIALWPGKVHTVLRVDRQDEILAKVVSWITSLHPNLAGDGEALAKA